MIVLDCSAGIAIAQNTAQGKALRSIIGLEEKIIAPSLYVVEVANVAWKYLHAAQASSAQCHSLMENALALPEELFPDEELLIEAFSLAEQLDHSVYDMLYVVLARRHAAALITCDKALQEACLAAGVNCVVESAL